MQMLVEGLAMGAFATFFQKLNDPLGRKLMQLVMTDEAFHHKFGKIWADRTVPKLSPEEHAIVEDWAAHCFQAVLFNLVSPHEQRDLYEEFGLDPDIVLAEIQKLATDEARREDMKNATNIFRVLIKTLLNAGIITDRTRGFYGMYVDMEELRLEGDRMVGDDIAEEGIAYLKSINFRERSDGPGLQPGRRIGVHSRRHLDAPLDDGSGSHSPEPFRMKTLLAIAAARAGPASGGALARPPPPDQSPFPARVSTAAAGTRSRGRRMPREQGCKGATSEFSGMSGRRLSW